ELPPVKKPVTPIVEEGCLHGLVPKLLGNGKRLLQKFFAIGSVCHFKAPERCGLLSQHSQRLETQESLLKVLLGNLYIPHLISNRAQVLIYLRHASGIFESLN